MSVKTLIVIWSDFFQTIEKHVDLDRYSVFVDIIPHTQLIYEQSYVWVINEKNECTPCYINLDLASCYSQKPRTGDYNNVTSYFSSTKFTYYKLDDRRPRYLIWPLNITSPINTTYIDRVDFYDLLDAFQRSIDWSLLWYRNSVSNVQLASIAVIDLDSTCIKHIDNSKIEAIDETLLFLREKFDILVLWSHGSPAHVEPEFFGLDGTLFDLILCNEARSQKGPKNLLFLYNFFPKVRFSKAVLLDDLKENATPEYSMVVIPLHENTFAVKDLL